jgi:hypothetical protein
LFIHKQKRARALNDIFSSFWNIIVTYTLISPILASFGKRRGSGSPQVAQNRELPITFFEIPDYQGFQAKLTSFRA